MSGRPPLKCSCGSTQFVSKRDSGEMICVSCGSVLSVENVDSRPQLPSHLNESDRNRRHSGSPLTLLKGDLGVSTSFTAEGSPSKQDTDRRKTKRLSKLQTRSQPNLDRRLDAVLGIIRKAGENLSLARHETETAAGIARKAITTDLEKRWRRAPLALASIYIACRLSDNSKRLDDVVSSIASSRATKSQVMKTYKILSTKMDIKPPPHEEDDALRTLVKRLELSRESVIVAKDLMDAASEARVGQGTNPGSVAAAAIYLANRMFGEKMTQKEICDVAKTTESTLRSRVKEIVENTSINVAV